MVSDLLFGLSLKEAALKLADDFGIQISRVDRRKIKKPRKILKSKPEKNLVKSEEQEHIECVRAMLDYRILLQKWKKEERGNLPNNTAVLFKKRTLLPVLMTYEDVDFTGYLYCFLRWQQRTLKNKIRKKIMYGFSV